MYQTCPKCGYRRQPEDPDPYTACPSCGLSFSKWLHQLYREERRPALEGSPTSVRPPAERLRTLLFTSDEPLSPGAWYGRAAIYLAFVLWSVQFLLMDYRVLIDGLPAINSSFMHLVNLVFHEAGHVLFRPFGDFLTTLGGSLAQLIIPLLVVLAFLFQQRDPFGASLGLWWLAQSLMDLAPYIYDAGPRQMILLGGYTGQDAPGYHDWHRMLSDLGLLDVSEGMAAAVNAAGVLLMLASLGWGGFVLFRHKRT